MQIDQCLVELASRLQHLCPGQIKITGALDCQYPGQSHLEIQPWNRRVADRIAALPRGDLLPGIRQLDSACYPPVVLPAAKMLKCDCPGSPATTEAHCEMPFRASGRCSSWMAALIVTRLSHLRAFTAGNPFIFRRGESQGCTTFSTEGRSR